MVGPTFGRARAAGAAGVAAAALLTGCGVGVGDAGSAPANRPAPRTTPGPSLYSDVAARMTEAGTARFVFSGSGGGETVSGAGAMRFRTGSYDADVALTMPQTGRVRAVLSPLAVYLELPAVKGLPKSKPWVRVSAAPETPIGRQLSPVVEQLRSAFDPEQVLGLLRSATRVEQVGPATVENVATMHYRADVALRRATRDAEGPVREQYQSMLDAGATTLRFDLWVDTAGLPRRYSADLPTADGLYSVTGIYRGWGAKVEIAEPRPQQVFDADKLTG